MIEKPNTTLKLVNRSKNSNSMESHMSEALIFHYCSYDKTTRPTVFYSMHLFWIPHWNILQNDFFHLTEFWTDQFTEVVKEMTLIPDRTTSRKTRVTARKEVTCFISLRRWRKTDTYDDARKVAHRGRCDCANMRCALFYEIKKI